MRLLRRLFRHFGLKVLSVIIAALLWLVVAGEQVVERGLRIPLEFQNLPDRLEVVGDPPGLVDVRVRGSSGALSRLGPGDLVAVLDLRAARSGRRLFHLTADQVRAPFGVEVVQVNPSNVPISFEQSASKMVPVMPALEGQPADGYVIGPVRAEPAAVEVVGPASALKELNEAITEPVSVAGADRPVRERVTIGVPDPGVRLRAPQAAMVTVAITAAPAERVLAGVPVHFRQAGRLVAQAAPSSVSVRVRGPRDIVQRLQVDNVDVSIDVANLGVGQYTLPVRATLAPGLSVVQVDPAQVRVSLRREE